MRDPGQLFDYRLRPFLDRARIDCDRLFEFDCPKHWGELSATEDPKKRHCSQCDREVHLAVDEQSLRELAKNRACVAVLRPEELPDPEQAPRDESEPVMMLGRIRSEF